ncbi:hypothetical protein N8131_06805 [Flavobacteriaceae bacterium]|jgi:small neutral amino acid transporter SnatA (MarC family)|nr:hypothetical protein [Flavobacteriaceae bacterium]|tara:strand:- start:64 stop:252 length:189 start_codon:yes stop_codon:yes gene_type:complete
MELLAYTLAVSGLFILIKGAKPSIEWIGKNTNKDLSKVIGFILVALTISFYLFVMIKYLIEY